MKKKIIWSIVAIVIIIAALMGILYYTTDMFKSEETLFYKHLADNNNFLGKTTYADTMSKLKTKAEASSENAGEITAKITSNETDMQEVAAVLEKGKITYNMKNVGTEKKTQGDITLNYDGHDVVTLDVLRNEDQYGIKIAEAYDKYISVENNNLKALFQTLGADTTNVPDKIETVDYYELLNVDNATLKHIEDTYSKVLKQNISKESYMVEKNVTVTIDGTNVTTNAYKLTLTEEQVKTVLVKLLETLKSDDTTLDLIVNKYNMMMEPYKTMGMAMTTTATNATLSTKITKEDLVDNIDESLQELNDMSANTEIALEIVTYAAKDNKAKIEVNIVENSAKVEIDMTKEGNDKKAIISCTAEELNMTIMAMENDEKEEANITLSADDTIIEINTLINNKTATEVTMKIATDETTIELNAKDEVKSTENITVDSFTADNSVKLNDMTQTEMQTLVQTIATNVQKVLPEKAQLLGINL